MRGCLIKSHRERGRELIDGEETAVVCVKLLEGGQQILPLVQLRQADGPRHKLRVVDGPCTYAGDRMG